MATKPVLVIDGNVVGDITEQVVEDSVSVTADGVKTIGQLLNDLYSITDITKIGEFSVLKYYSSKWGDKNYAQISATVGGFVFVQNYTYSGHVQSFAFALVNDNSSYIESDNGTTTDKTSTLVPQSGSTLTLYYGSDSIKADFETHANKCMMSDGETSVESALTNVDTLYDGTLSSGSSTALAKGISNYRQIVIEFAVAEDISGTGATQITIVNPRLNIPYIMSVALYINPTLYNNVAAVKFTDNTHISFAIAYKNGWSHDSAIKRVYGLH